MLTTAPPFDEFSEITDAEACRASGPFIAAWRGASSPSCGPGNCQCPEASWLGQLACCPTSYLKRNGRVYMRADELCSWTCTRVRRRQAQPGLFTDCCGPSALCAVFDVLAFCGSQNIAHLLRGFGIIVEVHGLGYAARALVRICAALFSAASHTNRMKADLLEATRRPSATQAPPLAHQNCTKHGFWTRTRLARSIRRSGAPGRAGGPHRSLCGTHGC